MGCDGFAADFAGQHMLRPVTGMLRCGAGTIGFAAAAHHRRQTARAEVTDGGQFATESVPTLLKIIQGQG
jgi:hypothetical protein